MVRTHNDSPRDKHNNTNNDKNEDDEDDKDNGDNFVDDIVNDLESCALSCSNLILCMCVDFYDSEWVIWWISEWWI